jgi:hypothetical protein
VVSVVVPQKGSQPPAFPLSRKHSRQHVPLIALNTFNYYTTGGGKSQ